MRSRHFSTIRSKIFIPYISILTVVILLTSAAYYFLSYNTFIKNYTRNATQHTQIVSGQITDYLEDLNSQQKRIIDSEAIRLYIFEQAAGQSLSAERTFHDNMYNITGYDFNFHHINILNLDDSSLITFGQEYRYHPACQTDDAVQADLIDTVCTMNGRKVIFPPLPEGTAYLYSVTPDEAAFSLCRSFGRYPLSTRNGIIEFQVSLDDIASLISDTLSSFESEAGAVLIYTEKGELIYPAGLSDETSAYYTSLDTSVGTMFRSPFTGAQEVVTSCYAPATGLTTMLIAPTSGIDENRAFFFKVSLGIALSMLLLLTAISYLVARSISLPITNLQKDIAALELDSISEHSGKLPRSGLNELELLGDAYQQMQLRLKQSLDDIVQTKTLSIHAQLMALQAQMNSHFLYNTLTVISIIAEEHDDAQVADMCVKLTRMLRYITEDLSAGTTLSKELEHTRNYSDLMSVRFGEGISFAYDIHLASDVPIPRLILQPLVENCVKYSRDPERQLQVRILLYEKDGYWIADIRDNGKGFSKEILDQIQEKIDYLNRQKEYPQLSINGMGMANIYLRLKLFYTDRFLFEITNEASGSLVRIGGKLHD